MALPSGYTPLEYIKASGTQYINTGFLPNQDSTVEFSAVNAAANQYFFGAWNVAYNDGAFAFCNDPSNVYIGYDGQGGGTGGVITGNHVIKLEKNIAYLDGAVFSSYTYTAFQVNYPLFLFGQNRAGTFFSNADGGICCEYCKIYDNGTLVRYLVPAMRNSDSTIGMYDTVNDVFYTNAGTGTFEAGPAAGPQGHRTMADGTSFEITAGRCMAQGTVYEIKQGRTMAEGTLYELYFSKTKTVRISGDLSSNRSYATVNGTKYTSACELEFEKSDSTSISVYVSSFHYPEMCQITVDGTVVQSGAGSYTFQAEGKDVSIVFSEKKHPMNTMYTYYTAEITTS